MIIVIFFIFFMISSNKAIATIQGETLICNKDSSGYKFITKDKLAREYFVTVKNKIYFDLRGYAKFVLIKLGFSNIWCSSDDTYKKVSDFFSYRYSIHNKFKDYGRMLSVIKS